MTVEEVLDWHTRVIAEAYFETIAKGKDIKVVITQELIDKHKAKAKATLHELLLKELPEKIDTVLETDFPDIPHTLPDMYNQALADVEKVIDKLFGDSDGNN